MNRVVSALIATLLLVTASASAGVDPTGDAPAADALALLDLAALMDIEVTTVSRRSERLQDAPAAVHVLTAEDIRRSGARNVPEALRLVPGLQVAQVDASKWAISARGANGRFANKLLVLVDGRSVYTPLFSGVFWDEVDVPVEEIERIEVVCGPGASAWGSNAVNGVINIITRRAQAFEGTLVSAGAGTEDRGRLLVRHGWSFGRTWAARVHALGATGDESLHADGTDGHDDWQSGSFGFRLDGSASPRDVLSIAGSFRDAALGQTSNVPTLVPPYAELVHGEADVRAGHVSLDWTRSLARGGQTHLRLGHAVTTRDQSELRERRATTDIDFQHQLATAGRHDVTWGSAWRGARDRTAKSTFTEYDPASLHADLWSLFAQDDVRLSKAVRLIFGARLEQGDFAKLEVQPTVRLVWNASPTTTAWFAVSRALRTPSRVDRDGTVSLGGAPIAGLPTLYRFQGSPSFASERVLAHEAGLRWQPSRRSTLDVAVFYDDLARLRTFEPGLATVELAPVPHLVVPFVFDNLLSARSWGAEISSRINVTQTWRLEAWYALLQEHYQFDKDSGDVATLDVDARGNNPRHQARIRSLLDLPHHLELDASLHFTDRLRASDLPSHLRLDLRLGWKPTQNFELALTLADLLEPSHVEYPDGTFTVRSRVERRGTVTGTWKF